jgi:SOS-response transcriptional repressor LexA
MNRIDVLRHLIDARFNGKAVDFARAIGRGAAQVSQWLTGHRKLGDAGARHIEISLGLPQGYFDAPIDEEGNTSPGPPMRGRVPLISWVKAGAASEAMDLHQPGVADEWVQTTVQVREHTYALRVEGESMLPDFPPGTILVVEPGMDPEAGDFVIARTPGGDATFKQLVRDGAEWYLKPLNERFPLKPMGNSQVIGVVREAIRKLR